MRQFKVINTTPDLRSGLTIANFGMPIKLPPGSQVTLDKFAAQIDTRVTDIYFSTPQTFTVQTHTGGPIYQITVPAGNYATSTVLINTMRQLVNNAWNSFDDDQQNFGLKFDIQLVNNTVEMSYKSVAEQDLLLNVDLNVYEGSAITNTDAIIVPNTTAGYSYRSGINEVLYGGGFSVFFDFQPDQVGGDWYTEVGLFISANKTQAIGIYQETDQVIKTQCSLPGAIAEVEITAYFYDGLTPVARNVIISQKNGFYCLNIFEYATLTNPLFTLENIAPFVVNRAMECYGDARDGTIYGDILNLPGAGQWAITAELGSEVNAVSHTMSFDFSPFNDSLNCNALRRGLGLPDHVVLIPAPFTSGLFKSAFSIDFSILNAALDIAIELLDMPLDSFIVGDGQFPTPMTGTNGVRQQGSRKNILAYFTPELSTSENVYRFFQSEYQWLDLINKMPIELTSMTFRVFDPTTGRPLNATNLSFNFLIKDKDEMVKY